MIIDTSQKDIEVIGDIKEFKTSIDPKNLEFITTLLSSNLYSNPEQSFIREIVSNAWDSHVEAGTTDIPVIVKFGNNEGKYVTIRDYGTGLSPERVKEIYCNIGSSTKRGSNDFIGGFGIGKYSALACTSTVYITSYYEGIAYYYMMIKSGNSITTNLLMEKPTKEKNGVEVTIKNISNISKYIDALDYITFFPNVYIDGIDYKDAVNNTKIKRFNNFAVATRRIEYKALLGNVLYPIDKNHINGNAWKFLNSIDYSGIVIKFDIGELNITPNRENIIYTSNTIKKIEERILAAKKEINDLVSKVAQKDFDDISEYNRSLSVDMRYNPINNTMDNSLFGYSVNTFDCGANITYKGVDLRDDIYNIRNILNTALPNFKGLVYNDKIICKHCEYYSINYRIKSNSILILDKDTRLTPIVKSYLKDNYYNCGIMLDLSKDEFISWANGIFTGDWGNSHKDFILSGIYDSIMKRANRLHVSTDPDFLKYKADKSTKGMKVKDEREVILHLVDWKREKYKFNSFSAAVDFIKDKHKGIILTTMDTDDDIVGTIAQLKGYVCVKARKDIVADIKALNLKCLIDADWLMNKDPLLSTVKTVNEYFPLVTSGSVISALSKLNPKLCNSYNELLIIRNKYCSNYKYLGLAKRSSIPIDLYTKKVCEEIKDYVDKYSKAETEVLNSIGIKSDILTTALLIKTKAYRVSYEAYSKVKNNKILNVLCRK